MSLHKIKNKIFLNNKISIIDVLMYNKKLLF